PQERARRRNEIRRSLRPHLPHGAGGTREATPGVGTGMAYRDSISFGFGLTPWVKRLIIANVAVFLATWAAPVLVTWLEFAPARVLSRPWTPLTYMFVHAGFLHLLFNMLGLYFFGPPLEARWGSREFLKYYLICGLGGAALSFVFGLYGSVV